MSSKSSRPRIKRPTTPAVRPTRPARRSVPAPPSSAFVLSNSEIEEALQTGAHADLLTNYFGEATYAELTQLAQTTLHRGKRGSPNVQRVLLLPGIMGSKLGFPDGGLFGLDDVVWLDPKDIVLGTLRQLSLGTGGSGKIRPLGVILLYYLMLKLRLKGQDFDVEFWDYDWRQDLETLGGRLARHLQAQKDQVHIVAHSMGGLVARAAIHQGAGDRVDRLVMLGTPNHGSFLPTQALRATLDTVRKLAALDPVHTAEELCSKVFNTFPSLYQLLPPPDKFDAVDVYDPAVWPQEGESTPQPDPRLLRRARTTQELLAPATGRFHLIAGVNQDTVTDLALREGAFEYTETRAGDGTVPLKFAELSGASTHYIEESHGSLPNNARVAAATADLLRSGETDQLSTTWSPTRAMVKRTVTEAQLRAAVPDEKPVRGAVVPPPPPAQVRELLDRFLSGTAKDAPGVVPVIDEAVAAAAAEETQLQFGRLVVGRRSQHQLDICLARGDITQASARALVLGLFREVTPAGAAAAVDARMEGAISEVMARRMFAGNVGEVFMLPTSRHLLRAENVLFAGLGAFDTFRLETLELVAENTIRTLIRANVEDLATVLLGVGSGQDAGLVLKHLLRGFIAGLVDADRGHRFRRVIICEYDRDRFAVLQAELYRLAGTPLFRDVEVTFDQEEWPEPALVSSTGRGMLTLGRLAPNYLMVRQEAEVKASGSKLIPTGKLIVRSALLTSGAKATVLNGEKRLAAAELEKLLAEIEESKFTPAYLPKFGWRLGELLLADEVLAVLPRLLQQPLVVVHDQEASRVPWETLSFGTQGELAPALEGGVSRRYLADNLSVAKWLEARRQQPKLEVLLVVNPNAGTPDSLPGAEEEGKRVMALLENQAAVNVTRVAGAEATLRRLRDEFCSGRYDIVHYAGHAQFQPGSPAHSGLLTSDYQVLSGVQLSALGSLPNLVVFNACESARVRKTAAARREIPIAEKIQRNVGLAESLLRGGIANYVGTYWPVGDDGAKEFADVFYTALLRGRSLGEAMLAGRRAIKSLTGAKATVDWADYVHYGDHNFTLKQG